MDLEYVKRAIKRTYKRYIGERTDGKATILDVAKFFNIPIDASRIEDYSVKKLTIKIPSIEIKDAKKDITYTANYTGKAEYLKNSGSTEFNRVISISPLRKEESLYYIGSEMPIITKMTFSEGDYELTFEKEFGNYIGFGLNAETKLVVRYLKNVYENDKQGKQQLLSKIFERINNRTLFEQTYTYSLQHLVEYKDSQDKYCYTENGKVIYGVSDCTSKDILHYLHGICFETMNGQVDRYLPCNIEVEKFPELTNKIYKSGIVFRGGTDHGIHHTFTIFKTKTPSNIIEAAAIDSGIYLKYNAYKWKCFENENGEPAHKKVVVADRETQYLCMDRDTITSYELQSIIEDLNHEYKDNTFIQFVIKELQTFANKIDIQKGVVDEEVDPLSPKLFIYKTFDEIGDLISTNKEDYFKLIREQFEMATDINPVSVSDKTPALAKTIKKEEK